MRNAISILSIAGLLCCCTPATAPLHDGAQLQRGLAYICMAPDGTAARELIEGTSVICPPPARFVSQPYCDVIPAPPRDNSGFYRARARAGRDGSLSGDAYEGQPFCAVRPTGPPRP